MGRKCNRRQEIVDCRHIRHSMASIKRDEEKEKEENKKGESQQ